MAYRETFESCPRCAAALEDAGDVRACNACRGQWVLESVLDEMVIEMLPAGIYGRLALVPSVQATGATACPSCGVKMDPVDMFGVTVERCPKQHGVWFDAEELQIALRRSADPAQHSRRGSPPSDASTSDQEAPAELVFGIQQPGDAYREVRLRQPVIKIGRLDTCHVQLSDERVGRIHAVIDITEEGPVLIDLGTRDGTTINGRRVSKQVLENGDRILVGATAITFMVVRDDEGT